VQQPEIYEPICEPISHWLTLGFKNQNTFEPAVVRAASSRELSDVNKQQLH